MIKHLFKLIWNKKKTNALITIEILISFLVLFAVVTMVVYNVVQFNRPLGFSYKDVWVIDIDTHLPNDSSYDEAKRQIVNQILLAIRQTSEVENVCSWAVPPYSNYANTWGNSEGGREYFIAVHEGSMGSKDVLGLQLVEGRWFDESDKLPGRKSVIVNQLLQQELFGSENVIGQNPFRQKDKPNSPDNDYKIVGVLSDFRKEGEFSGPMFVSIEYNDIEKVTLRGSNSSSLLIKVKPGTSAAFEEKLVRSMESVAKGWAFDVRPLEEMRKADFKPRIAFMITVGLVATFLLLMVALGLIGVLWQNVSQRTSEIGLRRALGGTSRHVYAQILGELLALTTFGLIIGTIIIIQFPLLDLITIIPANVYVIGFSISITLMYLLTFFCGFYPSWLTIDIHPAEALHYE